MGLQNGGRFNFGNFETFDLKVLGEMTFGSTHVANHKKYYKGESGDFLQIWVVMSLVNPCMSVVHLCIESAPTIH
jgi:hypothetical protein